MSDTLLHLLAVSVGNTHTSFGLFVGDECDSTSALSNDDAGAIAAALLETAHELDGASRTAVAIASVNPSLQAELASAISPTLTHPLWIIGDDVPPSIERAVKPDSGTGQDRLLAAAAAYEKAGQACVVIDAGTAITIDFVDGVGVFQGGAILPGVAMMLDALSSRCAQLPKLAPAKPDTDQPYGKNTKQAMLSGVHFGIRGAVRMLTERYAVAYSAYPQVIATGGDAHLLFDGDDFIEHISDDLVLRGVMLACRSASRLVEPAQEVRSPGGR